MLVQKVNDCSFTNWANNTEKVNNTKNINNTKIFIPETKIKANHTIDIKRVCPISG